MVFVKSHSKLPMCSVLKNAVLKEHESYRSSVLFLGGNVACYVHSLNVKDLDTNRRQSREVFTIGGVGDDTIWHERGHF